MLDGATISGGPVGVGDALGVALGEVLGVDCAPGIGSSSLSASQIAGARVGSHSTSPYGRPGWSERLGIVKRCTPPAPTECRASARVFMVPKPKPSVVSELVAASRKLCSLNGSISRLVLVAL